jgi:hypothetical protein
MNATLGAAALHAGADEDEISGLGGNDVCAGRDGRLRGIDGDGEHVPLGTSYAPWSAHCNAFGRAANRQISGCDEVARDR